MLGKILKNIHMKNHRYYIQKLIGGYLDGDEEKKFRKVFLRCKYCKEELGELKAINEKLENNEELPEIQDDFYKKAVESLYYVEHRSNFDRRLENFLSETEKYGMVHALRFALYSLLVVLVLVVPMYLNIYRSFDKSSKKNVVKVEKSFINKKNLKKDNVSDIKDLIYLTNYFSGNISIPESELKDIDANRDGKVNTVDMTLFLHREVGDIGR